MSEENRENAPEQKGGEQDESIEDLRSRSSFSIWLILIPVFLLAAWPTVKLLHKANLDNSDFSEEDYGAFNSEGESRRTENIPNTGPDLDDPTLNVSYKSNKASAENRSPIGYISEKGTAGQEKTADLPKAGRSKNTGQQSDIPVPSAAPVPASNTRLAGGSQAVPGQYGQAPSVNSLKAPEQKTVGFTKGLMTGFVEKAINSPRAVRALFNNENVIGGFMSRNSVRSATASVDALKSYLKTPGVSNFANNGIVQAALKNQTVVTAVATSGLAKAMLDTPAAKQLMADPKAAENLISSNPELKKLLEGNTAALRTITADNPDLLKVFTSNPKMAYLIGQ